MVEDNWGSEGSHGKRKMNANPIPTFRLTDINSPFKSATARKNRASSVITSTLAINCHR